jgi:hypothetical protein
VWHWVEEAAHTIEFRPSTVWNGGALWTCQHLFVCRRQVTGSDRKYTKKNLKQKCKIESMKIGCPCHLLIKIYSHVFCDDTPFMLDYTPFYSPGGVLLALSLALGRIPKEKDVSIFFQDSLLPSMFSSADSSYLCLATRVIDEYLEESPLCTITAFWASRTWAWAGK